MTTCENVVFGLWYNEEGNYFTDDDGFLVSNPYIFITPNDLLLFKFKKHYMMVSGKGGIFIEMFYPDTDIDDLIESGKGWYI